MGGDQAGPVVAHSLAQALEAAAAAVEGARPLHLCSAPGAAAAAGAGWFAGLGAIIASRFPKLPLTLTLDCADRPGLALGALRRGFKSIIFTGDPRAAARLAEIAQASDAVIERAFPARLDLLDVRDAKRACRRWFSVESGGALG